MTLEMKTSEVLTKAKALIENPENWMQGDYSNKNGTCFCSLGAIAKVLDVCNFNDHVDHFTLALEEVVKDSEKFQTPNENFAAYNDRSTHAEVMEAFDKAIALSLSRGE